MTYEDLKNSPLGEKDVMLEKAAIWLEINGIYDASGMKKLFNLIEDKYQAGIDDYFDFTAQCPPGSSPCKTWKRIEEGYASSRILENLFKVLFICKAMESKKDVKSLLAFAESKVKHIKKNYKKLKHIVLYSYCICDPRRDENLLEVYSELAERLQDLLEGMQDAAR